MERRWGQKGSPWEFNLRDMFRWCQLMQADQSPGFFNPGQHVALVYADRMRTEADKAQVNCFSTSDITFLALEGPQKSNLYMDEINLFNQNEQAFCMVSI